MSVYTVREQTSSLEPSPGEGSDTLFINQRFEGKVLRGATFTQCTFANISFKDTRLIDCQFSACVFENCYFRKATLQECNFPASRFIDCELPKTRIHSCSLGTTRFQGTAPKYAVLEQSLPGEPNLCRDLCRNIATEASALGYERDARRYRLRSIEEHEKALKRGFLWSDQYSRDHYPELERFRALGAYVLSRASGSLWGNGELIRRLLLNLFGVAILLGPLLLYLARDHLHGADTYWDCLALSVACVLNATEITATSATGIAVPITLFLSATGLLFLGLFITYLFQAVTRR